MLELPFLSKRSRRFPTQGGLTFLGLVGVGRLVHGWACGNKDPRLFPAQAPKCGEGGWQGGWHPASSFASQEERLFFCGKQLLERRGPEKLPPARQPQDPLASLVRLNRDPQPLGLPSQLWDSGPAHPPLCASPGRGSRLKEPRLEASLCSRSPFISSV